VHRLRGGDGARPAIALSVLLHGGSKQAARVTMVI